MKQFKLGLIISFLFLLTSMNVFSQKSEKDSSVIAGNFIFVAKIMTPQTGIEKVLTSQYEIMVSDDSVICNLPYSGRAYTAPLDPSKNSLDFTLTDFTINRYAGKNGKWEITIKPNDLPDVSELDFTIFDNNTASLFILSNTRQTISYSGQVQKWK